MNTALEPKRVHCIGLGGVGVSAVAKLLLARGARVSGSDAQRSPIIDDAIRQGAIFYDDESAAHITNDIDLVVATDDAPATHPQRLAAADLGIPIENFSVTLGRLMSDSTSRICIAGTNGKSTTTALTGLLLAAAEIDPTVFVGSRVTEFDGNLRLGGKNIFVAEADEYRDHFLNYSPTVAVLTNIESDHLDYFGTPEKMLASYYKFVRQLPVDGTMVANADDKEVMTMAKSVKKVVTFGISQPADLRAVDVVQESGQQLWTTIWKGESLGRFTIHVPGEFNIMNALAAMAGALAVNANPATFAETISKFTGIWRRFQTLNAKSKITIVSDYAHHPTAVKVTLKGARNFYPGRRIVAVFQPHHHSRLTALFEDFVKSFGDADEVLIVETYTVPGRGVKETEPHNCNQLIYELQQHKISAKYAPNLKDAEQQLKKILKPGDVAIIMGAGDIWRMAEKLAQNYD